MKSKLSAAQTALSLGVKVFIGTGTGEDKLLRHSAGQGDGTYIRTGFISCEQPPSMDSIPLTGLWEDHD